MIFPKPTSEKYYENTYQMKACIGNTSLVELYKSLKSGSDDVQIKVEPLLNVDAYHITINENGVTIVASCDSGFFRAITSLRQLIIKSDGMLPYCEIEDAPQYGNRAYLLDISCGRMPNVQTLKRLIDLLAELKYNEFQIYLEGFCFKYKELPEYTKDFDCLTGDDIEELDAYCKERFIDLVPNQNSFGHLYTWLEQDEFKDLRVGDENTNTGTINILLDRSFEFIDKLYSSLLPHFSSKRFNIGLDEAFGLGKYQLEEICKEKGLNNVYVSWLNKLAAHVEKKYNKKVQFWADLLMNSPGEYKNITQDATALLWGYETIKTARIEKICADLQQNGAVYYVCPGICQWACLTGRFDCMNFNLRTFAECGQKYDACGYMLTDWGLDEGHCHFPVWSLEGMALGAQYAWNVGEEQHGGEYKNHFVRSANRYLDNFVFGGAQVAEWLYRLSQYYLLEPERFHSGTFCCTTFLYPLKEKQYPVNCDFTPFYDLKVSGDPFYFENIINYVNKCIVNVQALDFDENYKRQILLNAKMVILGAHLCIVRIEPKHAKAKYDEISALIDEVLLEYPILWDRENYPKGKEIFIDKLCARKREFEEIAQL